MKIFKYQNAHNSFLMDTASKNFNVFIPLQKDFVGDTLTGIASTTSVDRDTEKMSEKALKEMERDIKSLGVNLFENHEHKWENTLGVINDAELIGKQLKVKIVLDDPQTNPKIPIILNKLARGIKLGLSVGGNVTSTKWEYDKTIDKRVKVIDGVKLYEISLVGIPSNADSFVSLPDMIAKSFKLTKNCPICFAKMTEVCKVCFYKSVTEKLFMVEKATALPVVEHNGKKYYLDRRLGEMRSVKDPNDVLHYIPVEFLDEEVAGKSAMVLMTKEATKQDVFVTRYKNA